MERIIRTLDELTALPVDTVVSIGGRTWRKSAGALVNASWTIPITEFVTEVAQGRVSLTIRPQVGEVWQHQSELRLIVRTPDASGSTWVANHTVTQRDDNPVMFSGVHPMLDIGRATKVDPTPEWAAVNLPFAEALVVAHIEINRLTDALAGRTRALRTYRENMQASARTHMHAWVPAELP